MNTPTDDTSSPPPPRGPGLPAWLSVLASRVGFTLAPQRCPAPARVLLRAVRGLGRLVAALELTLVIEAGPELRSVIGSPVWGQYSRRACRAGPDPQDLSAAGRCHCPGRAAWTTSPTGWAGPG